MAAANLKKAAESKGITIKVETQGAQGPENVITAEDIASADAAIIASDVSIQNGGRFDDLPTLECGVQEAVKDAKGIIEEVMEAIS
jgi:fructose-specific phosphotransferase system IIB component